MNEDIIRVFRLITYKGPRSWVEYTISKSVKGTKEIGQDRYISGVTLEEQPELVQHGASKLEAVVKDFIENYGDGDPMTWVTEFKEALALGEPK